MQTFEKDTKCPIHKKNDVTEFCEIDGRRLCTECYYSDHLFHDILGTDLTGVSSMDHLLEIQKKFGAVNLDKLRQEFEFNAKTYLKNSLQELGEGYRQILKMIDKTPDTLITSLLNRSQGWSSFCRVFVKKRDEIMKAAQIYTSNTTNQEQIQEENMDISSSTLTGSSQTTISAHKHTSIPPFDVGSEMNEVLLHYNRVKFEFKRLFDKVFSEYTDQIIDKSKRAKKLSEKQLRKLMNVEKMVSIDNYDRWLTFVDENKKICSLNLKNDKIFKTPLIGKFDENAKFQIFVTSRNKCFVTATLVQISSGAIGSQYEERCLPLQTSIFEFSLKTGLLFPLKNIKRARYNHQITELSHDKIAIVGGEIKRNDNMSFHLLAEKTDNVELYCIDDNAMQDFPSMKAARSKFGIFNFSNNVIYAFGGNHGSPSIERFHITGDYSSMEWEYCPLSNEALLGSMKSFTVFPLTTREVILFGNSSLKKNLVFDLVSFRLDTYDELPVMDDDFSMNSGTCNEGMFYYYSKGKNMLYYIDPVFAQISIRPHTAFEVEEKS